MITLNRRLATLLGWTNIIEVPGALLGRPPEGSPESRDQCLVPNWEGDWRDCGPLGSKYRISVEHGDVTARAWFRHGYTTIRIGAFGDRDATARRAIVARVIAILERAR